MGVKIKRATCYAMFRGFLPLILLAAAVVRFNGFSLLYLLLVLAAPLFPSPSPVSMSGKTGGFLLTSVILCSCTLLAQVVFQAYCLFIATPDKPHGTWLKNCSHVERTLRQVGLQRLEPNNYENILRVILPDIGAFIITLVSFILCKTLVPGLPADPRPRLLRQQSIMRKRLESYGTYLLNVIGNFLIGLFLAGGGIANPSALCAVYFLAFLCLATWWACYKPLGRRFVVLRIILLVYAGMHLILLYLYQIQFFQEILNYGTLVARVVGLTALVLTNCRKPWLLQLNPTAEWWMYISPLMILLLYFTLACEIRRYATRIKEVPYLSKQTSPSHVTNGRSRRRHRLSASSERQVLAEDTNEVWWRYSHLGMTSVPLSRLCHMCCFSLTPSDLIPRWLCLLLCC